VVGLLFFAVPCVAFAAPTSPGGGLFLASSPIYQAPPPGIWDVNTMLNSGSIKNASGVGNRFRILGNEVSLEWAGNLLDQDLSTQIDPDSWLAEATFLGGGTLKLTGKIRDWAIPYTEMYDGLLLQADVSSFQLRETDKDSNILNSVVTTIRFTPTGGWLNTNDILVLSGMYDFALVGAVVGPMEGGPLNDFQVNLKSLQAFQINFNLVPEPASVLLLVLGACGLRTRRGRGVRS